MATNSVTLGDFARPIRIAAFVDDVYNGFRLLNLKNDMLRYYPHTHTHTHTHTHSLTRMH